MDRNFHSLILFHTKRVTFLQPYLDPKEHQVYPDLRAILDNPETRDDRDPPDLQVHRGSTDNPGCQETEDSPDLRDYPGLQEFLDPEVPRATPVLPVFKGLLV